MKELKCSDCLEECLADSESAPVFIFKHSTSCPVSAFAHEQVKEFIDAATPAPSFCMVKVIESRPVSNLIAETLDVPHASPQLILVKNRRAVWHTSHHDIMADVIGEAVQAHA